MTDRPLESFRREMEELNALVAEECDAATRQADNSKRNRRSAEPVPRHATGQESVTGEEAALAEAEPDRLSMSLPEDHAARFISETIAFLRDRTDGLALLETVRAALVSELPPEIADDKEGAS